MKNESKTETTFTPEQILEIEAMITNRLVDFHEALIDRDQISLPSAASRVVYSTRQPPPELRVIKNED